MDELNYSVNTEDNVVIINLQGKITELHSADFFTDEIDTQTLNGNCNIILNLEKLQYINSTGLNVLISTLTKSRNAGGDCILCNISPAINKLFIITKLNTLFAIAESVEDAKKLIQQNIKVQ